MDINRIPAYYRVFFNSQTWQNIAYLFIAFPTGLLYFILMIIGFSLGASLVVIGVGLFILLATGIGILAAGEFERKLANEFLDAQIPPPPSAARNPDSLLESIKVMFSVSMIRVTLYLFTKFFFGIFALVTAIVAVAVPASMILTPLLYTFNSADVYTYPQKIDHRLSSIRL